MKVYTVSHDDYFDNVEQYISRLDETTKTYSFIQSKQLCKDPMNQLITKYELWDKKILSLGPSFGHEEYWFYKNRCILTFIDIDESNIIENYLRSLAKKNDKNSLTYFIGDASDYAHSYSQRSYDVFYASSFTPDELRRRRIISQSNKLPKRILNKLSRAIFKKELSKSWPANKFVYMDLIIDLAVRNLTHDGLFVSQIYAGGINVRTNPHFVELTKSQLSEAGLFLLKIYYLKARPDVTLTISIKGGESEANAYLEMINHNKDIASFHGRSPFSRLGCGIAYQHRRW